MGFFHWLAKKFFSEEFKKYEQKFAKYEAEIRAQPLFEREAQKISENVQNHFNHYMNCREAEWNQRSQVIFREMEQVEKLLDLEKLAAAGEKILGYETKIATLIQDLESKSKDLEIVSEGLKALTKMSADLERFRKVLKLLKPLDLADLEI